MLEGVFGPTTTARFRRDGSAMLGLAVVVALIAFSALGPLLISADPNASDFALSRSADGSLPGPSVAHPLGTDPLFRDLLARLAHGGRLSLLIGIAATSLALLVGTAIGVVAAYAHSTRLYWLDAVAMRAVDVALAFPYLLLVTAIGVAIDRTDAATVVWILGLTGWTGIARITRAKALVALERPYVDAARALGARGVRIVLYHVLPTLRGTLLIIGSHAVAQMILAEAVLGYLTVGIDPPQASWGRMLHEAEHYLGLQPALVAVPGLAIVLSVLGFTRLGDGLADALEPKLSYSIRHRRARVLVDVLVLGAALALLGFGEPEPLGMPRVAGDTSAPRRGGMLRVATGVAMQTLDPAIAYDEAARAVGDLMFARLVTWDQQGKLVTELAQQMDALDGGARYRFTLRPGLVFHDGAPLDAAAVKRSLERTLHPRTPSPGASFYAHLRGFEAYRSGEAAAITGILVTDPRTVEMWLDAPDATFPSLLALGFAAPVCPSSGAKVEASQPTPPCGAGPFRLREHEQGQRIVLERFEGYHESGKPYLDGVEWLLNVPSRTQRWRFEARELDLIIELTGIDMVRFASDATWQPYRAWVTGADTHGVFLNTSMPPFDNRHLRRAVAFALDGGVLEKMHPGVTETTRVVPGAVPGPSHDRPMRRHDLALALEEMKRAGHPFDPATRRGGYPEEVDYFTVPDSFEQFAGEVFQQQLAKIGIRIRLRLVSWASFLSLVTTRDRSPMGWRGWGADYPDPSNFFEALLVSGAIRDSDCQNVSFFSSAELDDVVSRAHSEIDLGTRWQLYQRAEEIVRDEAPWVPVYTHRALHLWQPHVRGYQPHPVEPFRLRDVWLAERGEP